MTLAKGAKPYTIGAPITSKGIADLNATLLDIYRRLNSLAEAVNAKAESSVIPDVWPVADGGTGHSSFAKGDLLVGSGTILDRLPVGTDGQVPTADAAAADGVSWQTPSGALPSDPLTEDHGGTGFSVFVDGDILVGRSGGLDTMAIGTNGQLLTARPSADPKVAWEDPPTSGVASVTGTTNQVDVGGTASDPVLSTPQDIDTGADVQFGSEGLGMAPESGSVLALTGHMRIVPVSDGNSGAAKTIDWSTGNEHHLTLTADCTLTFTNPKAGGRYVLVLTQDGTGGWNVVWPGTVIWAGGIEAELSDAAAGLDLIAFYYDGSQYVGAGANASALSQGLPENPLAVVHGGTGFYGFVAGMLLVGENGVLSKLPAPTATGQALVADLTLAQKMAWSSLVSMGYCFAYLSSDTTADLGVEKTITLDVEELDSNAYHDLSTNPSRMTIPAGKGGGYLVNAGVAWGTTGVGSGGLFLRIYKNGALREEAATVLSNITVSPYLSPGHASWLMTLAAGDYIELRVYATPGVSSTSVAITGGAFRTFLRLAQVW